MPRSAWKLPYVDGYLLKKTREHITSNKKGIIKIWSRRSVILPQFVGINFAVYNGKKFISVTISEGMVGHKFGEFSLTRTFYGHSGDKKIKKD
jgi:small subunit ribosomal protein S19